MIILPQAVMANTPAVLELYTSQGCSSCPPADRLLKKLTANDPSLLALSFHVHYWDYLGWKDPYSSLANTERQKNYASVLDGQVYTPELVVNGQAGVVGSNESAVNEAIVAARQMTDQARVTITRKAGTGSYEITVDPITGINSDNADIWLVNFSPYARTEVANGENGGRTLEDINNVTNIARLAVWNGQNAHYSVAAGNEKDGIAVLVQKSGQGRILGAASYVENK